MRRAEDLENGMIVMLLDDAQKVLGKHGKMTGCTVKVKDTSEAGIAAVRAQIEGPVAEACGLHGQDPCQSRPDDFVKQNGQVRLFTAFAWVVSIVTLIISGILVLNTMFMSVFERTREIGILRAIGWRPSRVMRMILMESVLLSIGGGIVGTLGGLGMIKLLSLRAHGQRRRPAGDQRRYRRQGLCHCHFRRADRRRLSGLSRFTSAADGGFAP